MKEYVNLHHHLSLAYMTLPSGWLGGGVLCIMAYTGWLRPKKGSFFRLQVYERVGISLVKYIKG